MVDLIKIDDIFQRLLNDAINPRPLYPMIFMLRAHSAYRVGVSTMMGGQLYEAHALLRLCLEHAAYGFYIGEDTERMKRWRCRGDSDASRKATRKEFHNDKLRAYIKEQNSGMCDLFDKLYTLLIDFGAHPTELGYSLNTNISTNDTGMYFQTIYLQDDGINLDNSMRLAGQVGLWGLHLMQLVYTNLYERLGIRADLEEVRQRF